MDKGQRRTIAVDDGYSTLGEQHDDLALTQKAEITGWAKPAAPSVIGVKAEKRGLVNPDRRREIVSTTSSPQKPQVSNKKPTTTDATSTKKTQSTRKPATRARRPSARELKNRAIEQALSSVASSQTHENKMEKKVSGSAKSKAKKKLKHEKGYGKRFALAFVCATLCVGVLAFFVNLNMPDISVKVTALQTGIDASYPSYIPQEFRLSGVTSEKEKIIMEFNGPEGAKFTLTEERSSWDSTALLNNYVKEEWGDGYTATREKGITIYMSGSNAVWVNGGLLFTINTSSGTLTKKQIRSIANSL